MGITIKDLFATEYLQPTELFAGCVYPWEVVAKLAEFLEKNKKDFYIHGRVDFKKSSVSEHVAMGNGTVVEAGAVIYGPTKIGNNCLIRSGAYIRGNVILGDNVTVGHSVEIKNSVILPKASIAHFNYVGDSIVGFGAHLAAGAIITNTKLTAGEITVKVSQTLFPTGLRKFGAAVGDGAEVGSNAVLNPGSVLGKGSIVYPLISWRGVLAERMIAKSSAEVVPRI